MRVVVVEIVDFQPPRSSFSGIPAIRRSPPAPSSAARSQHEYVDGFVVPVPQENLVAYRNLARKAGKIWKEHGALEYVECVADDVQPGKHTSFPQSVKLKPGEVVVFEIGRASCRERVCQ